MKFASLLIVMNFIGQAEAPRYHLPELRGKQSTQRMGGEYKPAFMHRKLCTTHKIMCNKASLQF
jgi:hypothetical protein